MTRTPQPRPDDEAGRPTSARTAVLVVRLTAENGRFMATVSTARDVSVRQVDRRFTTLDLADVVAEMYDVAAELLRRA